MISSPDPALHDSRHPWLQRCLLVAVVLIPWWWLFGPSLVTNQTVAFRDAAHFHYPTFSLGRSAMAPGPGSSLEPPGKPGQPHDERPVQQPVLSGQAYFPAPPALPSTLQLVHCPARIAGCLRNVPAS